MKGSGETVKL